MRGAARSRRKPRRPRRGRRRSARRRVLGRQQPGHQPERAEIDRPDPAGAGRGASDGDLGRRAAEVDDRDGPGRLPGSGDRAVERERRLLRRRQDADRRLRAALERGHQLTGVGRLPAWRRHEHLGRLQAVPRGQRAERPHRVRRLGELARRDPAELLELGAEPEADTPAAERHRTGVVEPRDKQANGVRADVDHAGRDSGGHWHGTLRTPSAGAPAPSRPGELPVSPRSHDAGPPRGGNRGRDARNGEEYGSCN